MVNSPSRSLPLFQETGKHCDSIATTAIWKQPAHPTPAMTSRFRGNTPPRKWLMTSHRRARGAPLPPPGTSALRSRAASG